MDVNKTIGHINKTIGHLNKEQYEELERINKMTMCTDKDKTPIMYDIKGKKKTLDQPENK